MRVSILILTFTLLSSLKADELHENWLNLLAQNNFDKTKQSYCFKTANNKIYSSNLKKQIRPASVSKLFTTLWALEKLSKDYKYKTTFSIKDSTLFIHGSKDPFFVTENLLIAIGELQKNHSVDKIVFDKNFYFNWSKDQKKITKSLSNVLNTQNWNSVFLKMINDLELFIDDNNYNYVVTKGIKIESIKYQDTITPLNNSFNFTFSSSPLWMHLKQMNIYSNNFYADTLFEKLGSSAEFHKYLYTKFNINKSDTFFYTGSGLGENKTTCSTTLKVLAKLKEYSQTNAIPLTDLISVAGIDEGTLKKRFKHTLNKKVLAKTGTLRHTSTLAGFLGKTHSILFAIYNHTYERSKAREMQEDFLYQFSTIKTLTSFDYTPKEYVSIKDSEIKKGTL